MARVDDALLPALVEERSGPLSFLPPRTRLMIASWLPIVALLAAWEITSRSGVVTPFALPAFSIVVDRIVNDAVNGDLFLNIGLTLWRSAAGFVLAGALGILIGIAMGRSAAARWFFDPLVSVGFPMPKIAFLPIVILWLGFFDMSKITMVVISTVFPVITATLVGIQGVEKELIWSARSLGTSERRMLRDVILPAALPQILTGLQVALPIALIVCIITEIAMGGYGLGGAMQQASRFADSRGVFAGIVETTIVGYILIKGMAMLRRRLLIWHQEALDPSTA